VYGKYQSPKTSLLFVTIKQNKANQHEEEEQQQQQQQQQQQ
jgi:hypothetical protein